MAIKTGGDVLGPQKTSPGTHNSKNPEIFSFALIFEHFGGYGGIWLDFRDFGRFFNGF